MASKQEAVWVLRAQCGDREAFEITFGLAIFMTRLTKRILRAIDLALKA